MSRLGPLPGHGTEHEIPKADGLEALRWVGDAPVFCAGTVPETEIVALSWCCEYCGSLNQGSALYCGQFGPEHCGASRSERDEYLRPLLSSKNSCDGGVAVRHLDGTVTIDGMSREQWREQELQWQYFRKHRFRPWI